MEPEAGESGDIPNPPVSELVPLVGLEVCEHFQKRQQTMFGEPCHVRVITVSDLQVEELERIN